MFTRRLFAISASFMVFAAGIAYANDEAVETKNEDAIAEDAPVLLEVMRMQDGEATETVSFTKNELEALEQAEIVTHNEFVDGEKTFNGPHVETVIAALDLEDAELARFYAIDDYSVEITLEEINKYHPILAMQMDGEELTKRDFGPIWVMYPLDEFEELQDAVYNSRLIWQAVRIEIE